MRAIDAIGLKQALSISEILRDKKTIEQIIDEQPTIEPERTRGKWIKERIYGRGIHRGLCSCCGFDIAQNYKAYKFCPNCGSDNREGGHTMTIKTETTITFHYPEEMEAEVSFTHDNDMTEWVQEEFGDGSISYTLTKKADVEWGKSDG